MEGALLGAARETTGLGAPHRAVHLQAMIIDDRVAGEASAPRGRQISFVVANSDRIPQKLSSVRLPMIQPEPDKAHCENQTVP